MGGYRHIFQFYDSVGPLECIFMAVLTLSNAHFFHLIETSTMRLPDVKILVGWPSRMQIYGFVENHTFLERFVSRGYQDIFQFYGSVGPLECIFMALLTRSNKGAPAHFFHLM